MKKIIALALCLLMMVSVFAGCKDKKASGASAEVDPNLVNAKNYLVDMYPAPSKDAPINLGMDKDVLSIVVIEGKSYEVEWAITVTQGAADSVKIVESDTANCVKIDIPDLPESDILFTATATVKDANGNSETAEFKFIVKGLNVATGTDAEEILNAAYELAEGQKMEGTQTLVGKITSVDTPYSAQYKNVTVTITVEGFEDKPIKCYRLAGEGADTLAVGDVITVTGTLANYQGTVEFEQGCTFVLNSKADGSTPSTPSTPDTPSSPDTPSTPDTPNTPSTTTKTAAQIVAEAYALKNGQALSYVATLTGKVNNAEAYSEEYGGQINVTISVEGKNIYCYKMKGTDVDKVAIGDTITVTGIIKNYNGTIEFAYDQASGTEVIMNKRVAGTGTVATLSVVDNPVAGTAYKFGMVQKNVKNTVYYVAGGMKGYYMATTALPNDAPDVYLETTTGGFYLYYVVSGTKTYINMETAIGGDGKEHVNPKLESTAKTVYTYDSTRKTVVATATKDGVEGTYAIGTRNDKSYTTVGPVDVTYDGFHCQFYK